MCIICASCGNVPKRWALIVQFTVGSINMPVKSNSLTFSLIEDLAAKQTIIHILDAGLSLREYGLI